MRRFMSKSVRAVRFLFVGPMVLAALVLINRMTTPGFWWVQWPALGIGIAWCISLFRVMRLLLLAGGAAAAVAWFRRR